MSLLFSNLNNLLFGFNLVTGLLVTSLCPDPCLGNLLHVFLLLGLKEDALALTGFSKT